jgi:hypothetical protein
MSLLEKREKSVNLYKKIINRFMVNKEDFIKNLGKYSTILSGVGIFSKSLEIRLFINY